MRNCPICPNSCLIWQESLAFQRILYRRNRWGNIFSSSDRLNGWKCYILISLLVAVRNRKNSICRFILLFGWWFDFNDWTETNEFWYPTGKISYSSKTSYWTRRSSRSLERSQLCYGLDRLWKGKSTVKDLVSAGPAWGRAQTMVGVKPLLGYWLDPSSFKARILSRNPIKSTWEPVSR